MSTPDPRDAGLRTDPGLGEDLDATVRARREPGDDYDSALVDSFLEKAERRIDEAVDHRVRGSRPSGSRRRPATPGGRSRPAPEPSATASPWSRWSRRSRCPRSPAPSPDGPGRWSPGSASSASTRCRRPGPELFAGRGRAAPDD